MANGGQAETVLHIARVVLALRDNENQQRMLDAAVALQRMAASALVNRRWVAEAGGVQILAQILSNRQHSQVLHQVAAKALEDLAQEPFLQQPLGQCAIHPLLSVLQRHEIPLPLLLQATHALRAIMRSNAQNTQLFSQLHGVRVTTQLLAANSGPMSDGRVVMALLSLFGCLLEPSMGSYGTEAVTATNISSTLVLLLNHNSPDVGQAALQIIHSCAASGSLPCKIAVLGSLVAAGAMPALLQIAVSSVHKSLPPYLVVGILTAMVDHLPRQQVSAFLGTACLTSLTRLLSLVMDGTATSSYPTLTHLLQYVSSILHDDDSSRLQQIAKDLIAAGAVPVLISAQIQAEKSSFPAIPHDISCRLADLSEATAVDAMLPILLAGIEEEKKIVLVVLTHIAKHSATFFKDSPEAASTSWIGPLLTTMRCPDIDGRQLEMAVNILSMAAAATPYIRHAIKEAGAQEVLQKLVADDASTSCNSLPTESMPGPGLSASNLKGDIMQLLRLLQEDLELNVDTGEVPGSLPVPQACQDHRELFASQIQAPARLGSSQNAFATAPFSHLATVTGPPLSNPLSANHQENPASLIGNATQLSTDSLWKRMPGLPSGWHSITSSKASEYDDSAPSAVNGVAASLTTSKLGSTLPGGLTASAVPVAASADPHACTSRLGETSTDRQRQQPLRQQQQQQR